MRTRPLARLFKRHLTPSRTRTVQCAAPLATLAVLGFCATAPASAQVFFTKAWGWGVAADGLQQFETCTTTCRGGVVGGGAGELAVPNGVAVDGAGDVFVADGDNRIDEFSSAGAFIKAWGWGVADGQSQFETCTATCQYGLFGGGAGQLNLDDAVVVDGAGDVFVADTANYRIDEFSSAGGFIKAWGWGVADGQGQFETCTTACQAGLQGGGAGQFGLPEGIALDGSGNLFVTDASEERVDEFSSAGAFIKAWGWGVADGLQQFETCKATCERGLAGGGAGALAAPEGIALDGAGDVFVADSFNHRIDEFSSAGAFTVAWGVGIVDGANHPRPGASDRSSAADLLRRARPF